ncbi:hypothetical protein [Telmatospirillum sp. J64-1]|uniref:hypothetical protein n=1 Tax=Telmatospirillum sp. J64-1 TaxID=2502183 RepID=UPI00115EB2B0|nr:hypothetical protein [Telmatospirillum sp. J64-1]
MSVIVSLADYKNSRRIEEKQAAAAKLQAEQALARRQAGYDAVGREPLAMYMIDAMATLIEKAEKKARDERPSPAYCDPANEVRGAKYDATKGLSRKEIAARIRADIKEAQKAGKIDKGVKVSVRTSTYSGGGSIDLTVTALPESFRLWSPEYVAWVQENPHDPYPPFAYTDQRSGEYNALMETLRSIQQAYNRDNSDSMSDYFDCRFYGDVSLDWRLEAERRKAEGL